MEGGGNIPAHERALGIFRSVTRLRAAMSTTAEPAPTLWQRLQDERPGPATLRAGSATIGGAGSHRASAVASPVLSHAHCSTASAPRARMSNASAAGGNNTTSVNAMGGGGRPVKQAGAQSSHSLDTPFPAAAYRSMASSNRSHSRDAAAMIVSLYEMPMPFVWADVVPPSHRIATS